MTENEFKLYLALGLCAPGVWGGQKEATMYSYNGVVLPKLPDNPYPYGLIVSYNDGAEYSLFVGAKPPYNNNPNHFYIMGDGVEYVLSNNAWVVRTTWKDLNIQYFSNSAVLLWSNADIGSYNGNVILYATEPIPVYA